MKIRILLSLCALTGGHLYAQSELPTPVVYNDSVKLVPILKFAPLSLLDPTPTWQLGIEIPLSLQTSLQQEAGVGRKSSEAQQFANASVFRSRTEFRYYIRDSRWQPRNYKRTGGFDQRVGRLKAISAGLYWAGEFLYKRLEKNTRLRNSYVLHTKFGIQTVFSRTAVFDLYGGIGWRWITERSFYSSGPSDRDIYSIPSLSLGFKIGFAI